MIELKIKNVYVHQIANPPATGRSIRADIDFVNLNHLQISNWTNDANPGRFSMTITDVEKIGLKSTEQAYKEKFIETVLLASNLVSRRAAFSKQTFDASDTEIEFRDESLRITDSLHHSIGFHDDLDEIKVLEIIGKIHSLEHPHRPVRFHANNLTKSGNELLMVRLALQMVL